MVKSVSETVLKPEHYLLKTPLPIANKLGKKLKGQDNEHNTYNEVFHSHLQWMGSKKFSVSNHISWEIKLVCLKNYYLNKSHCSMYILITSLKHELGIIRYQ